MRPGHEVHPYSSLADSGGFAYMPFNSAAAGSKLVVHRESVTGR